MRYATVGMLTAMLVSSSVSAESTNDKAIATLRAIETGDKQIEAAKEAALRLQADAPSDYMGSLKAMKDSSPLGKNWLAMVAGRQYQKASQLSGDGLIAKELETFLQDQTQDGEARTMAFRWLTDSNAGSRIELLHGMLKDSSPELRYAAIDQVFSELDKDKPDAAKLQELLDSARHPDQVRNIIMALQKVDITIDQAVHFGFILNWHLIGPFDNRKPEHFDTVYEVEKELVAGDFDAVKKFEGKESAKVEWQSHVSEDIEGKVDLARLFNKEKGATVYAYATFDVEKEQPALVSLTTVNGNKIWLNGDLVLSNNVYHVGARLDQYVAPVKLKAGTNTIVAKIMQNEQTEPYAQEYLFHCRIADPSGKGLPFTQKP